MQFDQPKNNGARLGHQYCLKISGDDSNSQANHIAISEPLDIIPKSIIVNERTHKIKT